MLAPFIGSFLGVLIERLPENRPVLIDRSACDHCGHRLAVRDLVPLVSYVLARGRCRYCRMPIGYLPPAVECAALGVAIWAAVTVAGGEDLWVTCGFGWTLLTLAWIDAQVMILPDVLTIPLIVSGLILTGVTDLDALPDHVIAAGLGYLLLVGMAIAYRRLRGRDGVGAGDAKLLAAIGAFLGLGLLPVVVFLAACLGLMAAGVAMMAGRRMTRTTALPFGPCLAMAAWLAWLYGGLFEGWLAG
jgi:leader peptidase (prepilin peptidase) / N-methyltransferase